MSKRSDYTEKAKEILEGIESHNKIELLAELLELYDALHKNKQERFSRSVPLPDLFVDRWARAKSLKFGHGTSMYDSCLVLGDVKVGERTWIGPHVILDGSGGLSIGDNCSISANAQIYSHDSVNWAISGGEDEYDYAETQIGSNCYIGPNVVISKGVRVGSGAVIGANSFVNSDVATGAKVVGNPAKPLK